MKKYECCKCMHDGATPCVIEWGDYPAPQYCPDSGNAADWREVVELPDLPRPTVKDSLTVPEWCKIGKWVQADCINALGTQRFFVFGKIFGISKSGKTVTVTQDGKTVLASVEMSRIKPARVRPWTKENGPLCFRLKYMGEFATAFLSGHNTMGWGYVVDRDGFSKQVTMEDIAKKGIQLDGSPCGILEIAEVSK